VSTLFIIQPGIQSTVQDAGRYGFQRIGLTQSGAIDGFAYRLGQRLVGNSADCAALEVSYGGLVARADRDCDIAITGAPSRATISSPESSVSGLLAGARSTSTSQANSHRVIPHASTVRLRAGEVLTLSRPDSGIYSYVSIAGGIVTAPVFNSRSTTIREGLGGLAGHALQAGDTLPLHAVTTCAERSCYPSVKSYSDAAITLRLLPCFQFEQFPENCRRQITHADFVLTHRTNRMAACLEGPALQTHIEQLYSEATCLGAVQIPPDGQPIVLLNDRQTLGGYPKAGAVLSVDCARLAQARAGTKISFQLVTQTEANRLLWLHQNYERELRLTRV